MIYLASPYTASPKENLRRVEEVVWNAIMLRNFPVFSPIVYMARMAKERNAPYDAKPYATFNRSMLANASVLWICTLPGWENSVGVRQEYGWAKDQRIPCTFIDEEGKFINMGVPDGW